MDTKPKVYSYIRFSTPEQAEGDSERRQIEKAKRIAKEKGWELDESLRMTDRGLSGYSGENIKKGELGKFLALIELKQIAESSILVVENVDRLSRLPFWDAFDVVSGIIRNGIVIQTLSPEITYDQDAVRKGLIYALVAQIDLANLESEKKSERLKESWREKRKRAREYFDKLSMGQVDPQEIPPPYLTKLSPDWIKYNKETKLFELVPEASDTITRIFELFIGINGAGGLWIGRIEQKLNEDPNVWRPPQKPKRKSQGWRASYIQKLLTNRELIGDYSPRIKSDDRKWEDDPDGPIPNYFPQVIDRDLFFAVQEKISKGNATNQATAKGQVGKARNVFRGIIRCGYCGGSMMLEDKGSGPKGGEYLVCYTGLRKATRLGRRCHRNAVDYKELQELVLKNLIDLDPSEFFLEQDEQQARCERLRTHLVSEEHQLDSVREQIEKAQLKLLSNESSESEKESWKDLLRNRLIPDKDHHRNEIEKTRSELEDAERTATDFRRKQKKMADLVEGLNTENIDLRIHCNNYLKTMIDYVEVFAFGSEKISIRDEGFYLHELKKQIGQSRPDLVQSGYFSDFLKYAEKRLWSKECRMYRVFPNVPIIESKGGHRYSTRAAQIKSSVTIIPKGLNSTELLILQKSGSRVLNEDLVESLMAEFFDGRYLKKRVKKLIPKKSLISD